MKKHDEEEFKIMKKYYLFEGNNVVMRNEMLWYWRDRKAHIWRNNQSWMSRYYDAAYTVIEIDYDEVNEVISNRRRISGFWAADDEKLLYPEKE